ncbi:MAG TPA: zinc dependent phospholipase C family protein [Methylophilaceae bacterium]|jgi:hypothetical protein
MITSKRLHKLFWLLPFAFYSLDVHAWGLVTHLYFAQSLLWAMPLLDPRLQRAIKNFPELVMAGACLPDLALVSPAFRHTHHWENAEHLLRSASNEQETAIAIGYASHLYVDVIAHNHFVPAHEAMWLENTMLTHIASEWAMDAHLAPLLNTCPGRLLNKHHHILREFIAPRFRCSESRASQALNRLAFWDNVLRAVRLPHMIYGSMRLLDSRVFKHFVYYIAKTQTAIASIGIVLEGGRPEWEPELKHLTAEEMVAWRRECLSHLDLLHPAPIEYFNKELEALL